MRSPHYRCLLLVLVLAAPLLIFLYSLNIDLQQIFHLWTNCSSNFIYPKTLQNSNKTIALPSSSSDLSFLSSSSTLPPCPPTASPRLCASYLPLISRYPSLLSYKPMRDCQKGRYLYAPNAHNDGPGTYLARHAVLLHLSAQINLTQINFPFDATHTIQEPNYLRDRFFRFYEWEIDELDWKECPAKSNVKKNIISVTDVQLFMRVQFDSIYSKALTFIEKGEGFTVRFDCRLNWPLGNPIPTQQISMIYEARWLLQQKKVFDFVTNPQILANIPHKSLKDTWISAPLNKGIDNNNNDNNNNDGEVDEFIHIAYHVRRGDQAKDGNTAYDMVRYKFQSNEEISTVLHFFLTIDESFRKRMVLTLFTETPNDRFDQPALNMLDSVIDSAKKLNFHDIRLIVDGRSYYALGMFVESDIFISSPSSFSRVVSLFRSTQLLIGQCHERQSDYYFAICFCNNLACKKGAPVPSWEEGELIKPKFQQKMNDFLKNLLQWKKQGSFYPGAPIYQQDLFKKYTLDSWGKILTPDKGLIPIQSFKTG